MLPGNHERAPGQPIQGNAKLCSRATSFVLPGNLIRAPGQPESCSREYNGRKSLHTGARACARAQAPRATVRQNPIKITLAPRRMGLRTYKINLLGKIPCSRATAELSQISPVMLSCAPEMCSRATTSVLPGNRPKVMVSCAPGQPHSCSRAT